MINGLMGLIYFTQNKIKMITEIADICKNESIQCQYCEWYEKQDLDHGICTHGPKTFYRVSGSRCSFYELDKTKATAWIDQPIYQMYLEQSEKAALREFFNPSKNLRIR
jgi:hypothetical protein